MGTTGTFVLITPLDRQEWDARALLQEYQRQLHCERHFHFLKDPLFVDALFVKKPERVEALGYVLVMACLLYRLMERRARRSAIAIPSPARRVLTHLTGHEIIRHLHSVTDWGTASRRTPTLSGTIFGYFGSVIVA